MAKRSKFSLVIFLVVALALAGGVVWFVLYGRTLGEGDSSVPDDLVAVATRRDIETRLLLSGEVVPAFQVEVKPEVGGKVKELRVVTGEKVKKGDLLAVIDDTDLMTEKAAAETEIEGAQLSVDKNRGNYERAKALFEEKLISKEVYANLEADKLISENSLEKAVSKLQSVEDRLSKTRILAPADGTVLDIPVNEGQVVTAAASVNSGTVIMTFADLSGLLIDTHVNQMDINKVHEADKAVVNMQGDNAEPIHAKISFIAPLATVKNNIKGFQVQALVGHDGDRLKPGMSVSMVIPVGEARGAVSVPIAAVFNEENDHVVYVRTPTGGKTVDRRKVEVGLSNFSHAEIKSGLAEGEEILLVDPKLIKTRS